MPHTERKSESWSLLRSIGKKVLSMGDPSLPGEGDTILTLGQVIHSESRGRKRAIIPFPALEAPCPHILLIMAGISSLHLSGHFSFPTS